MITIAIVLSSTRPRRLGEAVAQWVLNHAVEREDAQFELIDLAAADLPPLDEAMPPATGHYSHIHTQRWAETIARFDGYLFITPEYNHGPPGSLKNALDRLYAEWNNKAAAFVSYGSDGGVRAVEALRPVMSALQMADVCAQVALNLNTDFIDARDFNPAPQQAHALTATLDQLIAWSKALAALRTQTKMPSTTA